MELTKKKLIAILVAAFLAGGVLTAGVGFAVCKGALGYVHAEGRVQQYEEYI